MWYAVAVGTKTSAFHIMVSVRKMYMWRCSKTSGSDDRCVLPPASSLPGTCSPSQSALQTKELAGVFHDGFRGTKIKGPARDAQYKTKYRNALNKSTPWTS
jgi:hypothetical protein